MNKEQKILARIARQLGNGILKSDLTTAEEEIVIILVQEGYIEWKFEKYMDEEETRLTAKTREILKRPKVKQ
jgi:hypothetical protein